jgi:hypothetical protein
MGWEKRGDKQYYYRTRRVRGRVVREYFGCGPEAAEAARHDAEAQAKQFRIRMERARTAAEFAELEAMFAAVDAEFNAAMNAAGYHLSRGVWRKKRKPRDVQEPGVVFGVS